MSLEGSRIRSLTRVFEDCARQGRAGLVAYLAAGDPDLATTEILAGAAARGGADVLELGLPFSDPLADGPVIQGAYARALAGGATLQGIFRSVARISMDTDLPIVLMTSYNPVLVFGLRSFCEAAASAGVAGLLVPDLLPESAGSLREIARDNGLDLIFLGAPDITDRRLAAAATGSSGFFYLISRRGVTGSAGGIGNTLEAEVERVRQYCDIPVAVGFGVTTAEDARRVARVADGVIAGSVLVEAAFAAISQIAGPGMVTGSPAEAAAGAVQERVSNLREGIRTAALSEGERS